MFPIIETTHVLALGLSVGTVIYFDLRLLGVTFRNTPVSRVFHQVLPWMVVGFGAMFMTGALLFSAHAATLYESPYFRIKVGLLALAAVNLGTFHLTIDRRRTQWDQDTPPPFQARVAGALSVALWLAIIAAGRFTAYTL